MPAPLAEARPGMTGASPAPVVLVAGNPNSGKSTLFNALTGSHVKVSNYPGVTVARSSASLDLPGRPSVELVDLPGTYSLSARSRDEQVAVDALLGLSGPRPSAVIVVTDATALARTLYFVNEVVDTGVPVVVALSMADEARASGLEIDATALAAEIGAPVVPVVATRREGLDALKAALAAALAAPPVPRPASPLPPIAEAAVVELTGVVARLAPTLTTGARAYATWLLLSLDDETPDGPTAILPRLRDEARRVRAAAEAGGHDLDLAIISGRYHRVDAILAATVHHPTPRERSRTDRIDTVLTHRVWGVAIFTLVMVVLFQALFAWSQPAITAIEAAVGATQAVVAGAMAAGPLRDLLVDGVLAGVGNVVVFVPQIALLFLLIGVMEDVGYLARVAFVIDRVMGRIGLHGRSFVPMLSGFSCAVPAVLATRTLENRTDRMLTMMVLPLMSCSARLPIYVLVTATIFSPTARVFGVLSAGGAALLAMYLLSVAAALGAAAVLRRTVLRGPRPTLVLELPPYRRPVARVLLLNTWRQVRSFLVDAGTVILALTIVLWVLLSYPRDRAADTGFAAERAAVLETWPPGDARDERLADIGARARGAQLRYSVAGRLGHLMEPVLAPLGFDWRIGVGILGAFAAREVFVSTMGMVFDITDADERNQPLRAALAGATRPDGTRLMTPLTGLALMVFFVLACQCMSTLAVVRRESGSWRWPLLMFGYQTALAYVAALVVYQGGRAVGFS